MLKIVYAYHTKLNVIVTAYKDELGDLIGYNYDKYKYGFTKESTSTTKKELKEIRIVCKLNEI